MPPRFSDQMWNFVTPPGYLSIGAALRDLYQVKKLSLEKVGQILGVSKTPLLWKIKELGIATRTHGGYRWGKKNNATQEDL